MTLATAPFRPIFAAQGSAFLYDPRWLEAIAMVESAGREAAFRYEPAKQDGSFGLMQVMGTTARNLGLPAGMRDAALCEPDCGVLYGCKALVDIGKTISFDVEHMRVTGAFKRFDKVPEELRCINARYNGGGKGNPLGGPYRNSDYADRVATYFRAVTMECP